MPSSTEYVPLSCWVGNRIWKVSGKLGFSPACGSGVTTNGPLIGPVGPMIERTWPAVNVDGSIAWSNVTSIVLTVLFRTRLLPDCADPAGSLTPIRDGAV